MKKILLIEDSRVFGSMLQKSIQSRLKCTVDWYKTLLEARETVPYEFSNYKVALLDLNLPDAQDTEIVDFISRYDIPMIIFTSEFNSEIREKIWAKRIVDYVHKEGSDSLNYVVQLINNLETNQKIKILVVDDSKTMRNMYQDLLDIHNYHVLTAEGGQQALEVLEQQPDIKLITVDYNMPEMDGIELVKQIRKTHSKEKIPIIGISSSDDKWMSAIFIKSGANDYLSKPFLHEEFYCRILHNLNNAAYIQTIKDIANKDHLTGLYNRRYFFNYAESIIRIAKQQNAGINVAILDIDFFKSVNDRFGHDFGDITLIKVAQIMSDHIQKPNILARMGGEEFAIITIGNELTPHYEKIRAELEATPITYKGTTASITISIGVYVGDPIHIDDMIKQADQFLYAAKENGRNRIISS